MSNFPNPNGEGSWFSSDFQSPHLGIQEEDKVSSLVNKMTVNNLVIVAGEGYVFYHVFIHFDMFLVSMVLMCCFLLLLSIIGRSAFTNSHEWILLNDFAKNAYPPEVRSYFSCV